MADEFVLRMKWKRIGHEARMADNRWTKRFTNWKPPGTRRRGLPRQRWRDDIVNFAGDNWEELNVGENDGLLHLAVDGPGLTR